MRRYFPSIIIRICSVFSETIAPILLLKMRLTRMGSNCRHFKSGETSSVALTYVAVYDGGMTDGLAGFAWHGSPLNNGKEAAGET